MYMDLKNVLSSKLSETTEINTSFTDEKPTCNTTSQINMQNIFDIVDKEKQTLYNIPWNKMDKSYKTNKIIEYIDTLKDNYNLNEESLLHLKQLLLRKLNYNHLNKKTVVQYDERNGKIISIRNLEFNNETKLFTFIHKTNKPKTSTKTKSNIERLMSKKKSK